MSARAALGSLPCIREFFARNQHPIYFVGHTNYYLLGVHEWIKELWSVTYVDCFDGRHSNAMLPARTDPRESFPDEPAVVNHLLRDESITARIQKGSRTGFLFFDEETESLCQAHGLRVCSPSSRLRAELDDKIAAARLAEELGVRSAPHTLAKVDGYASLLESARSAGLGADLVVQTALGDSGHTTFFVGCEADYVRCATKIEAEPEVKIMRRLSCQELTLEACATRHGVVVGPLMTELVGFEELTPYAGGWCGNELFANPFSPHVRQRARIVTRTLGDALYRRGYRGMFSCDYLYHAETDELYLSEINPRFTGASSLTNLAASPEHNCPMIICHLLEWWDIDFDLDVERLSASWADPEGFDPWSQLTIKRGDPDGSAEYVLRSPRTGIWKITDGGQIAFARDHTDPRAAADQSEAFFLCTVKPGTIVRSGQILGVLLMRTRAMTGDFQLTDGARAWTAGIRRQYRTRPAVRVAMPSSHE